MRRRVGTGFTDKYIESRVACKDRIPIREQAIFQQKNCQKELSISSSDPIRAERAELILYPPAGPLRKEFALHCCGCVIGRSRGVKRTEREDVWPVCHAYRIGG